MPWEAFWLWVNLAHWCTAYAISGHELVAKYNNILMTDELLHCSANTSPSLSVGKGAMKYRLGLSPGTPRFVARRIMEDQGKLGAKEHATYTNGIGTLLCLTEHSRPDLCNALRELSKTLDKPAPIHLKERNRIIRYVLATKCHG